MLLHTKEEENVCLFRKCFPRKIIVKIDYERPHAVSDEVEDHHEREWRKPRVFSQLSGDVESLNCQPGKNANRCPNNRGWRKRGKATDRKNQKNRSCSQYTHPMEKGGRSFLFSGSYRQFYSRSRHAITLVR